MKIILFIYLFIYLFIHLFSVSDTCSDPDLRVEVIDNDDGCWNIAKVVAIKNIERKQNKKGKYIFQKLNCSKKTEEHQPISPHGLEPQKNPLLRRNASFSNNRKVSVCQRNPYDGAHVRETLRVFRSYFSID